MRKSGLLAMVVLVLAAHAGCGDDDDDATAGDQVSSLIRAQEGGTLVSADGALRVTIPPGALVEDTEVFVETSDVAPPPGALSAVYDVGPNGLQFEEPVTLELVYEEESLEGRAPQALHVAFSTNDGLAWGCISFSAVDEATHSVLVAVDHFSQHVLHFDPCDEDADCRAPETCRLEAAEGYCALECADRQDCPYPLDCFCGVCGRQPCRGGDDDCTAWETFACSIDDGPGVCQPPCTNEGDACGSSFDAGQASCTAGLHCTFDALCDDPVDEPFDCAAGTSCAHGWCVPRDLGCPACDDGAPHENTCDDLASEDCLSDDDEDGDGFAGCADDDDCGTDPLCTEALPEDCATAGDEDEDGFFDCADTDCAGDPACPEDCATAGDEDQDGDADCADTDCAAEPQCDNAYQGVPVLGVATKTGTTCAVTEGGALRCWGRPESGVTGQGNADIIGDEPGELAALPPIDLGTDRTATAVVLGYSHACALLDDSSVKCWGSNGSGELGQGDTEARGDEPGEMGDALPPVDLGTGRSVQALSGGQFHTCAILDDGTVKCWGDNFEGSLGIGDALNRGDEPGEMGDALPAIDLGAGRSVVTIDPSQSHMCAVLDDGSVKCWGSYVAGALGNDLFFFESDVQGDEAGEMGDVLPAVDLGTGRTAITIVTNGLTSCVILDDRGLKCWGQNSSAQLGLGDVDDRSDDPGEMGDALPYVDLGP